MDSLRNAFVTNVLYALVVKNPERLSKGEALRKEMLEQMKRGEKPTGYRADWLKRSAHQIIGLLERIAKDFNEQYPDDKCSAQDMGDILATANHWLKNATNK